MQFLRDRIAETAVPPTYDEIKDHLGLPSKTQVVGIIRALEARGKIRRLPKRQRAIEVLDRGYPKKVPVLDTTRGGYRFFVVERFGDADPILLERDYKT